MEVVEEPVVHNTITEEVLVNVSDGTDCISSDAGESHKPNGVADPGAIVNSGLDTVAETTVQDLIQVDSTTDHVRIPIDTSKMCESISVETVVSSEPNAELVMSTVDDDHPNIEHQPELIDTIPGPPSQELADEITELLVDHTENIISEVVPQAEGSTIEVNEPNDKVTFKTEILVERNENDVNENDQNGSHVDGLDSSKNMLNVLRQNLELSDVLQSDVVDNMENNNSSVRQEVLNKEELLDILEGDVAQADDQFMKIIQDDHTNIKTIEAQLALQQLTRLKSSKSRRSMERTTRRKKGEKRLSQNNSNEVKAKKKAEGSVDENDIHTEDSKSKRDKKNSSTSFKTTESPTSDNKTKKDKKSSDDKHDTISTETKNKRDKQVPEAEGTQSVPLEVKPKRNRKTVEIILKVSESESKSRKDNRNALVTTNDSEIGGDDGTLENDSNKPNNIKENIVNDLVRDWEDDEPLKDGANEKLMQESEGFVRAAEDLTKVVENVVDPERIDGSSMDSSASFTSEGQAAINKNADENQPQRRLGRVIKKKVIFDPDNPDTFTKGKTPTKNKETPSDREQPVPKKIKTEVPQRPKSKSPTGKLHWKKPPPKASKQNKRLSEVDRLLMDEGAVNMIYQLTPEAPKGKKNMRTKAEFIKKIQSSTPDGKEMKFRERKKENIKEEGEAKKIIGGKQRGSLSSSVKSVCEDFEAHSADDSIIYRRHSSSSYSSNCMSPLRVNDQDTSIAQAAARVSRQTSDSQNLSNADEESVDQISEVFISDMNMASPSEVINKSDCLSIKQKLNSKLQNVLNKRKRDNPKTDKPAKQKKVSQEKIFKTEEDTQLSKLKNLTVKFDQNLAEIYVKRKGHQYTIETLKDLEFALEYINSKEDIAVTLLSSDCGTLCSSVDLSALLNDDVEIRNNNAICYAESIRSLLSTVEQHSKLLCTGVWGACSGVGLALAALSDVAVASERASFAAAPLLVGTAAFTSHSRRLPKPLVDNLVVFGRRLSAEEAMHGGLVSRVVWPDRFADQLRSIAEDIAKQPSRSLLVKKQLLTLNRNKKTFQSCLEVERDLLAEYWTSEEGMEALRATLDPA